MSDPLVFFLPMPPNLANARMHWRVKHDERLAYFASCDALQATNLVSSPPRQPLAKASVRSRMYLGNAMDDDNAMARHKWPLDWLVTRGYLVDDKRKCLTWEGFPVQIVKRSKTEPYRLVLTLTPLAA